MHFGMRIRDAYWLGIIMSNPRFKARQDRVPIHPHSVLLVPARICRLIVDCISPPILNLVVMHPVVRFIHQLIILIILQLY